MMKFIAKRVAQALIVIFLITCITFLLMNLVPGGPFLSEKSPSPQVLAALEAKYGLDKPVPVQLKNYIVHALQGDFGVSMKMQKNRPVGTIIMEMFPVSAKVGIIALVGAVLIGVPIGCIAAYYRGTWIDSALRVLTTIGVSIPGFVVATVLLILLGSTWKLLPTVGLTSWKSYIMPCFSLAFYPMCYIGRLARSSMLDVINQEYIRTAKAKGVPTFKIVFKHALRNAFIPVLTYLGPLTAGILTGGFVVETVFNIPGLGRYFVQSILNRDYPIIMGTTIFLASFIVTMTLVVDILYKAVDPRIDLAKGGSR
ncbi:MAG TPA: ABC transporter permease [Bacillota bacterium]|jgi:oligopeptide transport system permease protein|nr:ABC transporter permease [Bacillota bacterium]HPZ59090.1 ABC transporter permease [Bacillota bacterium]HQC83005.1 ABC transporter permease [Bacillota bacterium]